MNKQVKKILQQEEDTGLQNYQYRLSLNDRDFIISSDDGYFDTPLLLDRWDHLDEEGLKDYLRTNYKILLKKIKGLATIRRTLTLKEEKELQFILNSVLAAHSTLQDMRELKEDFPE